MVIIKVACETIHDLNNGVFALEIESRSLSRQETEMLRNLFPHFEDKIGELLRKEAMFEAMERADTIPETGKSTMIHSKKT